VDIVSYRVVSLLLQRTTPSDLRHDVDSVTAAFMRSCDNGYLRLGIFNLFVDAAIEGRIELELQAIYHQLVDHYMYRKPYDLARRPSFHVAALNDATCRITPLGHTNTIPCTRVLRYLAVQSCTLKLNPLECRGDYSAIWNNMKLVHWPLMAGLLPWL